ncbi:sodium-dependent glucose transporter 1A-like [Oppia nitens]|uniref:sodium-dependent glucose transporter 1A-like n=1 Tax=Oppia nitens TaxID=1686743 RepID=UPI0023DAD1C6|nr:sodium-dependent glucose transporter 1A-like [Oppia nitens]
MTTNSSEHSDDKWIVPYEIDLNSIDTLVDDNNNSNKLDNKYKQLISWTLFYGAFTYGMTTYIIGPALNDMTIRLNTSIDSITIVLGCICIGYTLGAIINGIIFNYISRQLVLTCLLILMACAISSAPHVSNIWLLYLVGLLCGFGAGGFDTAQVVWLIEIWAEKSSSYLQGLQFFNAVGTFVSPLMTGPFLAKQSKKNVTNSQMVTDLSSHIMKLSNISLQSITTPTNTTKTIDVYSESHIEIPFGIVGGLLISSALILLILHFYRRYVPPIEQQEEFSCKCPDKWTVIYIVLGLLSLAPYVGMEVMNFQLISSFAKYSHLQLSGNDSALVQTIMAGAFALFRGINFVISFKFWSENLLFLNFIIIIVGYVVILLFEIYNYSKIVLLIGVIIVGSGFSTIYALVYAFLEKHLTISNTIGGLFVCTSGLMAALLPTLCGQFIEEHPLALIYMSLICTIIIGISFTTFKIVVYFRAKLQVL